MLYLLLQGQYVLFAMILVAIIISLTFHEFGHAVELLVVRFRPHAEILL